MKASPQRIEARTSMLGEGMLIRRALPSREQRMIGAWCFLDHAGPVDVSLGDGMRVGPHPHIGLQTFTWMIAGEVLHRDSLGYEQIIRPGQVNLMTAGHGISHSEESPAQRSPQLHLAQLWIALPDSHRHMPPAFQHYPELPHFALGGFAATLLVGELQDHVSPVQVYTPMLGVDLTSTAAASVIVPLREDFEYGVLVLEGSVEITETSHSEALGSGTLLYLPPGQTELDLHCKAAARVLLIGGEPFAENVLLWWNFVARTRAEIVAATEAWNAHSAFGKVEGYVGTELTAPDVPAEIRSSR